MPSSQNYLPSGFSILVSISAKLCFKLIMIYRSFTSTPVKASTLTSANTSINVDGIYNYSFEWCFNLEDQIKK